MLPPIHLTKKNQPFTWNLGATEALESLKSAFISNPILIHVKSLKLVILEPYVFDFALKFVILQSNDKGQICVVAFHSREYGVVKINFEIHDNELLTIGGFF